MDELPETDPLKLSILYVQQWMSENGFHASLRALEAEGKLNYDETKLHKSSKLMNLVWRDMEEMIMEADDGEDATMRKEREDEEEALLRGGRLHSQD